VPLLIRINQIRRKRMQNLTCQSKSSNSLPIALLLLATFLVSTNRAHANEDMNYQYWKFVGTSAAVQAIHYMHIAHPRRGDFIVLTNAGYAEVQGRTTQGALDGPGHTLGVSRGNHSLLEIHSSATTPLWFAVFHKPSGVCTYLEFSTNALQRTRGIGKNFHYPLFSTIEKTTVTADAIFANPDDAISVFDGKIFNGNEFRIVTIINGILAGAPTPAIRAMEFHDHYCPGVTSGVFIVEYLNKYLDAAPGSSYFVQSVQPWCKEDALLTILNTTPGKNSYHLLYSTEEDIAKWKDDVQDAATIVYWKEPDADVWSGVVLGFEFGATDCPTYGNSVLDKLCSDLYYLKNLDTPDLYVREILRFTLPEEVTPKDYARPGVDPMERLGLEK
jgi:formylmethanofuran dehydrogenase subunit E-like metal-binding protein